MKTIIELMTALSAESNIGEGARIAMTSGLAGAKDIYLAWGKEKGESLKTLNEQWKVIEDEVKPTKRAGANGFAAMYYDWLAESSHTEQEARDLIMSSESQNVRNHLTHYLNIWALCETVRQGQKVARSLSAEKVEGEPADKAPKVPTKAKEPEFVYDAAHPFACEKSAAETLLRQKNLVAKKRDLSTLAIGAESSFECAEGFKVILRNTKKSLKIEE
jgi:hypothetical protein